MVSEILEVLSPRPGEMAVDCTLGYGGHTLEILAKLQSGGRLIGLDTDPIELPRAEARLRGAGFGPEVFTAVRSNFAGLPQVLAAENLPGADCILADLGLSSMQIDDPVRGFSTKSDGPLDMRMNPGNGFPVSALLKKISVTKLNRILDENADEPRAGELAELLAGREFLRTSELVGAVRIALPDMEREELDLTMRRVFQALRIAVNDEFSAIDTLLRNLPRCLNSGGRVAILTFHSGEDRRVKKAFQSGLREGHYVEVAREVIRPSSQERHQNPRSTSAKLRWARKPE